ncbi:MAG: GAF domain-containing protein [Hyphomicrobiaceae bacterium]
MPDPAAHMLEVGDVAAVMAIAAEAGEPLQVFRAVEALAQKTLRFRQLSVFRYIDETAEVERIHSTNQGSHAPGGRKRLADYPHNQAVLARGEIYVARDRNAVAHAYKDAESLFALGITSIMNVPIRHGGHNLGALNVMGEAGWYSQACFTNARTVAGLLVPTLLTFRLQPRPDQHVAPSS